MTFLQQEQTQSVMNSKMYSPRLFLARKQLYYIFTYYCSFGDRQNYDTLKIQNFRRMLTDAQLISNTDEGLQLQLDLLFSKFTRNASGVDFEMFLAMIPEISKLFFEEQNYEQGVRKIVDQNLHALYQFIFQNTDFGQSIRYLSKTVYSQNCFILLRSLSPTLLRIFLYYFDISSVKIEKDRSQIFKKLTNFTKNFEIIPQMLSKTQSFIIFNFILDQQTQSVYHQWFEDDKNNKHAFLYFHFIQFLFIVSITINRKIDGMEIPHFSKLVYFLEMMEVSSGFAKFCKTQQINLHLIPSQKLVKQLEAKNNQFSMISPGLSPQKKGNSSQEVLGQKFIQNYSALRQKFISFCLHGQTIGNSCLSHKKGINIIRGMKLGLKQSEIQVYQASIKKSLEFQQFMLVLQKIAQKQMLELDEMLNKFIDLPLTEEVEHQRLRTSRNQLNLSRKQYRNCVAMVQIVQKLLKAVFIAEAQPSTMTKKDTRNQFSLISLSSYLKIMHDFELSPIYVTKQSLIQIFRQAIKKSYDFMTFAQLKDSFIIAIPYLNLGEEQNQAIQPQTKMVVMFERINQSRGVSRLCKKLGKLRKEDYLIKFRQLFKQYYPEQLATKQYTSQQFQSILQ